MAKTCHKTDLTAGVVITEAAGRYDIVIIINERLLYERIRIYAGL